MYTLLYTVKHIEQRDPRIAWGERIDVAIIDIGNSPLDVLEVWNIYDVLHKTGRRPDRV